MKQANEMKEIERINGRLVLGHGETTSHDHVIETPGVLMFQFSDEIMQLRAPEGATLRHMRGSIPAEHRDIELPAGNSCVVHKRQYNPEGGWTSVRD